VTQRPSEADEASKLRVGFVGLGDQGGGIARRIIDSGFPTTLWARRAASLTPFAGLPAEIVDSCTKVGSGNDVLATCVFDADGTNKVLFGDNGAAPGMTPGSVVVVHSTLSPDQICEVSKRAMGEHGLHVVDAPVSGGGAAAAVGEVVTIAGADPAVFERVRPLLECFSRLVVHVGPVGAGQRAKLINNALLAAHLRLAAEVFEVGEHFDIDRAALAQVLANSSGRSFGVEMMGNAGSMALIGQTQAKPALIKDVGLLRGHLAGVELGRSLMSLAGATCDALDAAQAPA
jgi:3-hydroxyisobutyrate dehydrogenase